MNWQIDCSTSVSNWPSSSWAPLGVLVAWDGGRSRVGPVEVTVVNGLGAGDAFGAALCHGLLQGWDATKTVRFANAAGAYVAARLACADAMPRRSTR